MTASPWMILELSHDLRATPVQLCIECVDVVDLRHELDFVVDFLSSMPAMATSSWSACDRRANERCRDAGRRPGPSAGYRDTKGGIDSAVATALMSHYFVYDVGTATLSDFLAQHVPGYDWSPTWTGPVPVHGISTVQAALTAVEATDSLSEVLQRCVAFTGDVDSVATIACACASSDASVRRDLPDTLWRGLENSEYGLDYIVELDERVRRSVME